MKRARAVAASVAAAAAGGTWAWLVTRRSPDVQAARLARAAARVRRAVVSGSSGPLAARAGGEAARRPVLVVHPRKPAAAAAADLIDALCDQLGIAHPPRLITTVADPGTGQARLAVADGADVVIALGGDGTARAVAAGLAGSACALGLVPLGTGNLLARNLGIPVNRPEFAAQIALTGATRRIDVGRLRVGDEPQAHVFLVIAGIGFDASMVSDTREELKRALGWPAYFAGGFRNMWGSRPLMRVQVDGRIRFARHLRSVMVANCGFLPANIALMPDAVIDDGLLDVAAVDARVGPIGWWHLYGQVMLQSLGVRFRGPGAAGEIVHIQGERLVVTTSRREKVQIDGEWLGAAGSIQAWVEPAALSVRH